MKVLDLDLDCFIEGIAHYASDNGARLDDQEHPPWNESRFRNFLENRCGLSRSQPINGRVFTRHVEIFGYWRGLIDSGRLTIPFSVTHVDAHSDMGLGGFAPNHICQELLPLPPGERIRSGEALRHLDSGSFLAYALAFRWISDLTFVHHIDYLDGDDFVGDFFKDNNPFDSGIIELKRFRISEIPLPQENRVLLTKDPDIPFQLISVDNYQNAGGFDYATICQSPGFTPESADVLLDVFREYIIET